MVREHAKLIIQTSAATDVLADGWYAENAEVNSALKRRNAVVSGIAEQFTREDGLPPDGVAYLFGLNRELRRLHDAGPALMGESFDKAYEPLLGYSDAIDRFVGEDS